MTGCAARTLVVNVAVDEAERVFGSVARTSRRRGAADGVVGIRAAREAGVEVAGITVRVQVKTAQAAFERRALGERKGFVVRPRKS